MQLVSAAARKTFSDAPAARPPNETMTGQRLSFGGRSTLPSPAPTNRTVASQPKVGRRAAAGTTTAPEVRLRQRAEATRHPRARPTEAQVRHFDPARRNPYAQGTGPLAPDNAASAPAGHAAGPRVTPSAIRDEPTVENQTTDLSRAHPTAAQIGHFETPRRNPYAQRTGPLAPNNAASACRAAGPRATPPALRHQPLPGTRPSPVPARGRRRPRPAFRNCPPQPVRPEDAPAGTRRGRVEAPACRSAHDAIGNPAQVRHGGPSHRPFPRATSAHGVLPDSARRNPCAQRTPQIPTGQHRLGVAPPCRPPARHTVRTTGHKPGIGSVPSLSPAILRRGGPFHATRTNLMRCRGTTTLLTTPPRLVPPVRFRVARLPMAGGQPARRQCDR